MYEEKYLKYKKKYLLLKKPAFMLFKADWCGHCNEFKPLWNELINDSKLKKKYNFMTIDSNDEKEVQKYNIKGYPTLLLKKDDKIIEFDGTRDRDTLIKFLTVY
jgi:thiol-disulfide isomerase/thioredoxin